MKFILNGLMVLTFGLMFAQCAGNNNAAPAQAPAAGATGSSNMKIAFVEIDSLLSKYNFCTDLTEEMIRKEENARTTLNEKGKKLEAEAKEFDRKLQNNGFASIERAEQERARLLKQQQELQELQPQESLFPLPQKQLIRRIQISHSQLFPPPRKLPQR